jgi:DNA-binding MarR family transcriptional regulator
VPESPFRHDNVLFSTFRIASGLRQLAQRAVEGSGVSTDEYGVLSGILVLGPVSPTELAAQLGIPATTMSVYLGRFVDGGLVRRLPNPEDGRSYLVELTDAGHDVIKFVAPRMRREHDALMARSALSREDLMLTLRALEEATKTALDADTTSV